MCTYGVNHLLHQLSQKYPVKNNLFIEICSDRLKEIY